MNSVWTVPANQWSVVFNTYLLYCCKQLARYSRWRGGEGVNFGLDVDSILGSCVCSISWTAGLGGSVGCAVRLETRRSRVQSPPRSATFFHGDWSWSIFYCHSLPFADSRRAVVIFWRKNVHNSRPWWLSWMRRPTGDQEVAGQPPPRSATFFRGDWSWNIFYGHSLPSADSRRAVVSFWRKNVHNTG